MKDRRQLETIKRERIAFLNLPSVRRPTDLLTFAKEVIGEQSASVPTIQTRQKRFGQIAGSQKAGNGQSFDFLLDLVDAVIEERSKRGNLQELTKKLHLLCGRDEGIVCCNKGKFSIVEHQILLDRYGRRRRFGPRQSEPKMAVASESDNGVDVGVVWWRDPEYWTPELLDELFSILRVKGIVVSYVPKVEEGCTTVYLRTTDGGAQKIVSAFHNGELASAGVVATTKPAGAVGRRFFGPFSPDVALAWEPDSDAGRRIRRSLRAALWRERGMRPWRRLRYLFSPSVARSPLWHTIAASDDRAYANPGVLHRWKSLRTDLGMTLLLWPLLTAAVLTLALLQLPMDAIESGVLTGVALAVMGAQPCSLLISPLACGAGVLAIGSAFGLAHAMIIAHLDAGTLFSRAAILNDFFLSVEGGLVGISGPAWRSGLNIVVIVALVCSMAVAIAMAGWLMAQPQRASEERSRRITWDELRGAAIGASSGAGIGLVYGLNRLMHVWFAQPTALIVAFSLVSGVWMGISTFLRFEPKTGSGIAKRAVSTGITHAVAAGGLIAVTFWTAGTPIGRILLATSNGFFQSTFFTTAFVIGLRHSGPRAAFGAVLLEGALGFTVFLVLRISLR